MPWRSLPLFLVGAAWLAAGRFCLDFVSPTVRTAQVARADKVGRRIFNFGKTKEDKVCDPRTPQNPK
eukprot:4881039-Amphidinium_carterae.1